MAGQAGLSRLGAVTFLLVITINLREDPHRGGCGGGSFEYVGGGRGRPC